MVNKVTRLPRRANGHRVGLYCFPPAQGFVDDLVDLERLGDEAGRFIV
tara:strand:- start:331 stop:474 length:144 start_codon:yes stop_codon:yes gene_type:complete